MYTTALHWLHQYGYLGIFSLLALGIVGIPVPDEILLSTTGYLASRNELQLWAVYLSALLGCLTGITVSYGLGSILGWRLIGRYGPKIGLNAEHQQRLHAWCERFGRWALVFAYFVPGVRHWTALFAGAARMPYRTFALYAYSGAVVWTSTFIVCSFYFGKAWIRWLHHAHRVLFLVLSLALIAGLTAYILHGQIKRR